MDSIDVLIADIHPMFREGVRSMLRRETGIQLVGEAKTGSEAIALTAELQPDVILMEVHMPDVNGIEATRRILLIGLRRLSGRGMQAWPRPRNILPGSDATFGPFISHRRAILLRVEYVMDQGHAQRAKDAIRVTQLDARNILTETRGFTSVSVPGTGFHYSLNPYRGCTFNCSYCYAPAFVFDDEARQNWGRRVAVKANAEQLLRAAGRKGKLRNKNVYMSTTMENFSTNWDRHAC